MLICWHRKYTQQAIITHSKAAWHKRAIANEATASHFNGHQGNVSMVKDGRSNDSDIGYKALIAKSEHVGINVPNGRDFGPTTNTCPEQAQEGNKVQSRVEGVGQSQAQCCDLITEPLTESKATTQRVDTRPNPWHDKPLTH